MSPLLYTVRIGKRFGGVTALENIDIAFEPGTIHAIIGPNGAGKTTFINACTGISRATVGQVFLESGEITTTPAPVISRLGVARTFQNVRLFRESSVLENVLVGAEMRRQRGFVATMLGTPRARSCEAAALCEADRWLETVGLQTRWRDQAGALPHGSQRMLELARALATEPRVLFLDEPAAGLHDDEVANLGRLIGQVRDRGVAVVLVEHNMPFVMSISDWVTVLNFGKKIASGLPGQVARDPHVIEAYMGIDDGGAGAR